MKHKYTPKQGQYLAFIHYYTRIHGHAPAEADMESYFSVAYSSIHQMILTVDTHGQSPWHFTGQAVLDLNADIYVMSVVSTANLYDIYFQHSGNLIHPRVRPVELCRYAVIRKAGTYSEDTLRIPVYTCSIITRGNSRPAVSISPYVLKVYWNRGLK